MAVDERFQQMRTLDDLATSQASAAITLHKKALKRLKASNKGALESRLASEAAAIASRTRKVEAVLELKSDLEIVRRELLQSNERKNRERAKAEQELLASKDRMLSQGLNPYLEFRSKEIEEEAIRTRRRLEQGVVKGKKNLFSEMNKEERRMKMLDEAAVRNKVIPRSVYGHRILLIECVLSGVRAGIS